MSDYVRIYRSINTDVTIGNFKLQDGTIPFAVGILTYFLNTGFWIMMISLIVSLFFVLKLKEINETKFRGYYKSMLRWYFGASADYQTFPKPHERSFVK